MMQQIALEKGAKSLLDPLQNQYVTIQKVLIDNSVKLVRSVNSSQSEQSPNGFKSPDGEPKTTKKASHFEFPHKNKNFFKNITEKKSEFSSA